VRTHALVQFASPELASVEGVHTAAVSGGYRRLQDSELIAILLHQPAALVRQDSRTAKLIFLNPADSAGFPAD
jgi:hypothetical protein